MNSHNKQGIRVHRKPVNNWEDEISQSNFYQSHCLDLDLNDLTHSRYARKLYNPKMKDFLKSREPILRKSYLSTFIHIYKHMDVARYIFWIKSLNGTFLAHQIKAFGPKFFWFSCMGKKVPFWQYFKILSMCLYMWIKVDK